VAGVRVFTGTSAEFLIYDTSKLLGINLFVNESLGLVII
jgi:hypothetical protein